MTVETLGAAEIDETAVSAFAAELRGRLIRPADPEYDSARAVWNGMIDRYPALIARCRGTADVVAAVTFARERGLLLSVRGGGHNVAGGAVCDGGLVIDLSLMRGVSVDPAARTARVQGGATWGDVDRETQLFGLAAPGGMVSTTGVAGLTLQGGLGWLRSKYGLGLDSLRAVEIVTADGQVRTASEHENADLFWAMRGAGPNFGVVTSFEFQLHPVGPMVAASIPIYAFEDAPAVVAGWRDFLATAGAEVTGNIVFWSIPAIPMFAEELHGRQIVMVGAVDVGDPDDGERRLRPLRRLAAPLADLSGPFPYTVLQSAFDAFYPAGDRYYWKSHDLTHLTEDVISTLCEQVAARPSPRSTVEIWHCGGAISRIGATQTAFARRDGGFLVNYAATWSDPAEDAENIAWARAAWRTTRRFSDGGVYLNFPGLGEEKEELVRAAYGPNYERLVALKTKYDPGNLFRMNQNIPPAP